MKSHSALGHLESLAATGSCTSSSPNARPTCPSPPSHSSDPYPIAGLVHLLVEIARIPPAFTSNTLNDSSDTARSPSSASSASVSQTTIAQRSSAVGIYRARSTCRSLLISLEHRETSQVTGLKNPRQRPQFPYRSASVAVQVCLDSNPNPEKMMRVSYFPCFIGSADAEHVR